MLLRRMFGILLVALEIVTIVLAIINKNDFFNHADTLLIILSLIIAIYIAVRPENNEYKVVWILLVLASPVFGGIFYLLSNLQIEWGGFKKRICKIEKDTKNEFFLSGSAISEAEEKATQVFPQIAYLEKHAGFPVYQNTGSEYLSIGEDFQATLLNELEKAEKYIFIEFFIIAEGKMWSDILEVLKRKAKEGVLVRVLYDDIGSFIRLPANYPKDLALYGIECCKFNSFKPLLTTVQNNRDHRKICSIDGKVAFTGGINIADEYTNEIERHGHWKDCGVVLRGRAAWSFTVMFLQMWKFVSKRKEDYKNYLPSEDFYSNIRSDGFVQPYADNPLDKENVGKNVYMNIISNAKKYLYICTPYLIVDDAVIEALKRAAEGGVDVRIITPHIWDKWPVHMTTRSYYRELISAGVKVYEYTDGFIHSKTFVSDDIIATVGTTNLDYRSLYLNFECGVLLQKTKSVLSARDDFLSTLEVCKQITPDDCKGGVVTKAIQNVLRLFAPLM